MENNDRAREVREEIMQAFKDIKHPGGHTHSITYEDTGESQDVADAFCARSWQEMSLELTHEHNDSWCFLTPAAYRYFLPAYIYASLQLYNDPASLEESVLYSLTPPKEGERHEKYEERMQGFSPAQRRAIRSFLEFIKEDHPDEFED